jgi:chromosome segregation ATPase
VNEDLRRSIRSEIESLDADIDTLQGNIKNEDRISAQLAKDFAHSRVEMVQLRRSAADELDSAMMREQVRTRLKASLRSELMSPTSVVAVVSPSQNDNSVNATNDSSQNENATNKPPLTTHDYLKEREADLKELATSIAKDKAQVMDKKAQMADLDRQTDAIYARIKSQELEQELEAAKNETALRRQELAEEERLKRTTKEKIQKVRSESAHYAVQIGENAKLLASKKTKNEDQEAELALRVKHFEQQLGSNDSATALENQLASLSGDLETLKQQIEAFETIRAQRKQVAEERVLVKTETQQLLQTKEEYQGTLEAARSKHASNVALLEQAKARQAAVEAERIANDKVHAEQILPGQVEKNHLMEQKQELAKTMNKLHEESLSNDKENNKGLATQSETLNKLDNDLKLVKGELTEKLASIESVKSKMKEAEEATQKELKEHEDFRSKFTQATASEKDILAELQSERKRQRRERCEAARKESNKMRANLQTKLEILRAGAEMLSTTAQLENQ